MQKAVNWAPQYEVSVAGTLKPKIHSVRAAMQVLAEVS